MPRRASRFSVGESKCSPSSSGVRINGGDRFRGGGGGANVAVSAVASRLNLASGLHSASDLHLPSRPAFASDSRNSFPSQFVDRTQTISPQQQERLTHIKEQRQYQDQAPSALSISYDDRQCYDHASGLIPASDTAVV